MFNYIPRRLVLVPLVLVLINFSAFAYAHLAQYVQQASNPYGTGAQRPAVLPLYADYAQRLLRLDFGQMPNARPGESILDSLAPAAVASAGLLALAFVLSVAFGLALGLAAVRVEPARIAPWLTPFTTFGLAVPSFYVGLLMIGLAVYLALRGQSDFPLPLSGFGWDAHLIVPTLALMLRPTMQITQVAAGLLVEEIRKQYVVTARSVGNTWRTVRWKHALRNALAPVLLTIAGSLRLSIGELVLVEWLFSWPGLGRLLTLTLIAPNTASPAGVTGSHVVFFLNPPLLAALLTIFTLLFLLMDALASSLVRAADPRLRVVDYKE
jgi:peptide/nickel transport system permease protein